PDDPMRIEGPAPLGSARYASAASESPTSWASITARRPVQIAAAVMLVAAVSAGLVQQRIGASGARGTTLSDSVMVAERVGARGSRLYSVTGSMLPTASLASASPPAQPAWMAELTLPWINPRVSPEGRLVALERITPRGTDIYVVSADQRDTIPLALGPGDDLIAGWSPDESWLLVINVSAEEERYRSVLHAYSVARPGVRVVIDTASANSVVDAAWSHTGLHIAWTARTGPTRQQDIFVAASDGTAARNVTKGESEEYHPAWSPNGDQLAFTSDRDGDAEIYSVELGTDALRRLTFNSAQDDRAAFSPDGDFIAFESTREGRVSVYAMPPLGGSARRLTPVDRNFELLGWRGRRPAYLAELQISAPATLAPGASTTVTAIALDQYGSSIPLPAIEWVTPDDAAQVRPRSAARSQDPPSPPTLFAERAGTARIVARAGAWRADTALIMISMPLGVVSEDFTGGLSSSRWKALGDPSPVVVSDAGIGGGAGLVLRSDRQWESGVLGTNIFPLRPGLSISARVRAPFSSTGQPGGFTLALVAAEASDAIDISVPQFLKMVALTWLPEAGRLAYSADREFWSEVVRFGRGDDWYHFRIEVESDGRIAFYVEGRLRRRSNIIVAARPGDTLVQLWIAGRGTGDEVVVDDVRLGLESER
ncbi:MAG: hypothetical protein M3403_04125, partial [Gemmatimonadota bacterium]|nr:hypothetical protein [Gemmatimonadota bacterium]